MFDVLIHRIRDDSTWRKIPWHEEGFSRRMLREHLSQEHDAASRRLPQIDREAAWVHESVLGGRPASILDLACGPGFYTHRFVELGHTCTGIDFGPASIEYARTHHRGEFVLADVATADYGEGYDLVCMIYGEFNAFSPASARRIVEKAHRALRPGGALLLDVMSAEAVRGMGQEPGNWYSAERGLWSDSPHIVLRESSFADDHSCSWHYVIDAGTGAVEEYVAMHQAYSEDDYASLLSSYREFRRYPSLSGDPVGDGQFFVVVASK